MRLTWNTVSLGIALTVLVGFGSVSGSLVHKWKFSATCEKPSTSLDGVLDIVFDSASYVVGGIRLENKILPFHGRHLGDRVIARTDTSCSPTMRLDCTLDSSATTMTGVLQISRIRAQEPRKKAKDYENVIYQVYVVRE